MESRPNDSTVISEDEILTKLANALISKIYANLNFTFESAGSHYTVVSANVRSLIKNELLIFLGQLNLTSTQKTVLTQNNLQQLATDMAGTLTREQECNIVKGTGINTTGLTTIYYHALQYNIEESIQGNILQISLFHHQIPLIRCRDSKNGTIYYAAAIHNVLKGSVEERKKAVLNAFSEHFLLLAMPEQYSSLCEDLAHQPNSLRDEISYTNRLLSLMCYSKLLFTLLNSAKMLNNKIHVSDISNQFGLFFGNKEVGRLATVLPCVNKAMAKVKEDEIQELNKRYLFA